MSVLINHHGEVVTCSPERDEIANEILRNDGADYDIRPDGDAFLRLWTRKECANRPWQKTNVIGCSEAEIFEAVISRVDDFAQGWAVMSKPAFDAMCAELEANP